MALGHTHCAKPAMTSLGWADRLWASQDYEGVGHRGLR